MFDKLDYFDFDIKNFPFPDGGLPRSASCGVCVSRLLRFAWMSGRLHGFGALNKVLAADLLKA